MYIPLHGWDDFKIRKTVRNNFIFKNNLNFFKVEFFSLISFCFHCFLGTRLCMNPPVDQHLLQLVQQDVKLLENAVQKMSEESEDRKREILDELQKCWFALEDTKNKLNRVEERVGTVEETVCDLKGK